MEVSHQNVNEPEAEARHNDDPGAYLQFIKTMSLKIGDDGILRLFQ